MPVEGKLAREMTRLVKLYNESQKEVEVTAVYTGGYDDTKLKAQAAAKAGKPPSVVLMSANFNVDLKLSGDIISLEPMLKADETTRDEFLEGLLAGAARQRHGRRRALRRAVPQFDAAALLQRRALQGGGPRSGQAAAHLGRAGRRRARSSPRATATGFLMPAGYDYLGWLMEALSMSNGGRYFNEEYGGEVYYDQPSMLGAARFVEDLIFKHKVMPQGVTEAGGVSTAFFAGKVSMMLLSTGSLSFVRENMKQPYDVAFVPKNVRNAVPIGGASLVMFAGQSEESRKAGWKFIKWLTSTETLGGWSRFTGYFAPRKSAYDKPEMKEFIAKNPDAKVALDQLPYAKPWFATYQTVAVRKALEDEIQAVMNGKKKADQAVKDAQKKADALMKPYVEQTSLKLP